MIRLRRSTATISAFVLLCLLSYTLYHPRVQQISPTSTPPVSTEDIQKIETTSTNVLPTPSLTYPAENAHRFKSADQFLPHIDAVTKIPNLSVTEAKKSCTWTSNDDIFFTFGGFVERDWVMHDVNNTVIDEKRKEWHTFVKEGLIPYTTVESRYNGRGIVVLAGNGDTLKRVQVQLRALVQLKSKLPVEIHYWKDELSENDKIMLAQVYSNILFNDLSDESNIFKTTVGILINYQLKSAALVNSRFAEPLMLDSDNVPVVDPATLYDSETYKEFGTIFWPDIGRTLPQTPVWALTNTPCKMDEYEQESGQLLVDKRRFFYHLQLAAWMNHHPYWNEFLLGDKDMFRFAWHALKTTYGRPSKWLTSVGIVQDDGLYCGHSFAQYHPDGNIAFLHGGTLKQMEPSVIKHWKENGGLFRSYKKSAADEDAALIVPVGIRFRNGLNIPGLEQTKFWSCTDMYTRDAGNFSELVPGFDERFIEAGGFWMLDPLDGSVNKPLT